MKRWIVIFAGACGGLVALALLAILAFAGFEDSELGFHGTLALLLGVLLSAVMAIGLMALIFYSNRSRIDEEVHRADLPPE
ncbi:MAG: hypothetical protein ACREDZ_09700 [Kiloniellales bacterium]